jgi:NAD(P)-dependent dehydrogenase (short-subunit alcohol dehydrogenase family)
MFFDAIDGELHRAAGFKFVSAYAASKFGPEGCLESLQAEVAPFGINTTSVNPGYFRTELLTEQSTTTARRFIAGADAMPPRSRRLPI